MPSHVRNAALPGCPRLWHGALAASSDGFIAATEDTRRAMGVTRLLADDVDVAALVPRTNPYGGGHCLAKPGEGYIAGFPAGVVARQPFCPRVHSSP